MIEEIIEYKGKKYKRVKGNCRKCAFKSVSHRSSECMDSPNCIINNVLYYFEEVKNVYTI